MARYQKPSDPRTERPSRPRQDGRQPIPWLWLGLGVLVAVAGLALSAWLARSLLERPPLEVSAIPSPTIIRLTAPPSPTPPATATQPTPTFIPTLTPLPTPDRVTPPPELTIDYYAAVANTGGVGVTVRIGPGTDNAELTLAPEGTLMLVIGGPEEGSGLTWWQVRLDDGSEGWVAADFLVPAAAPQ